jgi:glycosyltransferase involved in cell wall biosynthesis
MVASVPGAGMTDEQAEQYSSVVPSATLISVIIPAFNEEKYIKQTIANIRLSILKNKSREFSWEIIICDNNSNDNTAKIVSEMGAKLAFESVNQISRARNSGANIAKGEWLLFIDADTFPGPMLMSDVLDVIESGKYIGCGSTVQVVDGTLFNKLRMERLNPFFRFFNICGGAFILCQREAFQSIHGFSTSLYAYEEFDFVVRLKSLGKLKRKKFTVLHHHPVFTSGRKGEYNLLSMIVLFFSNIVAVVLFILHYLLPKILSQKLGAKLLGYWYKSRR